MSRLRTLISYYGGKQMLLKHILPLIPVHMLFTEAFCGGCAVLFAKQHVKSEIINDTNAELINFYRVAQTQYPALKAQIDATLHSREIHACARHIYDHPAFFTPVERAWAVWVCTKLGIASMIDGTFGYDSSGTTTQKLRTQRSPSPRSCADAWAASPSSARTARTSSGVTTERGRSISSILRM
ncbi:DNA adenine methylase [Alistipes sp.]|uniref:DNA adenine methylase n=1 Tax=Alistipes sp. TaxID=1872444 RepID=UPI003AF04CC2